MKTRKVLTIEIAKEIKKIHLERPELFQHEIAAIIGLNQGRVSEVLNGKRFPSA